MTGSAADSRIALVSRLTEAFGDEIGRRDPRAAIPWPTVPTVSAMVAHLGGVHRWVAEVVGTRERVAEHAAPEVPEAVQQHWYEEGRAALLEALVAAPSDAPCWILGSRPGTVAFWSRRMVFETVKHLMDVRASGGGAWEVAPELTSDDYADGIDELLSEFLPRTHRMLHPLPAAVVLQATDVARSWRIGREWTVDAVAEPGPTRILARAGDLALALWERADPLEDADRFRIEGDRAAAAALRAAPIHPW